MNTQAVVPYAQQYQQPMPVVTQPVSTAFVQPTTGLVVPTTYVGANADFYYPPPTAAMPMPLDPYGMMPLGYRGFPRRYRKRGRFARAVEALLLGSESERLRAIEMQSEMMGYPPYGYSRGMYDDGYYGMRGDMYGRGLYGRCSYPHRRGTMCPECDDWY